MGCRSDIDDRRFVMSELRYVLIWENVELLLLRRKSDGDYL
jgi:hypothetical protein